MRACSTMWRRGASPRWVPTGGLGDASAATGHELLDQPSVLRLTPGPGRGHDRPGRPDALRVPVGVVEKVRSWPCRMCVRVACLVVECPGVRGLVSGRGWRCRRSFGLHCWRERSRGPFGWLGRHTFALEVPVSNIGVVRQSYILVFEDRTAMVCGVANASRLADVSTGELKTLLW